jgi:hypothetical protein
MQKEMNSLFAFLFEVLYLIKEELCSITLILKTAQHVPVKLNVISPNYLIYELSEQFFFKRKTFFFFMFVLLIFLLNIKNEKKKT